MDKIIRWGILGCGKIARKFAADLSKVKNATLYAVASRNFNNAEEFAQQYNANVFFDSYNLLVQNTKVDVIYIATPHSFHFEHTMLCLNNGKAVLCEKPFAINGSQVSQMIAKAKEKNLFLMEAMWSKFLPHYIKLVEIINDGLLGDIESVLINFGFKPESPVAPRMFDPALGGGTLLDIGIYNVFFALSVLGKPDDIIAHMTPSSTGVDEQCAVLFKYANGAMAQLFSTFKSSLPTEADISGSKGSVKLTSRFYEPTAIIEYYEKFIKQKRIISVENSTGYGYHYEAQHVTNCLVEGLKESPSFGFAESQLLIETLDEIRDKAGIVYLSDK